MWEYRLIWDAAPPPWWDETWNGVVTTLQRQSRAPEDRSDTYLVIADRPDIGLKQRGKAGELELKVRHDARDGWELWEKIPFFTWNALESARFAALLQRELPHGPAGANVTPIDGVKALLSGGGVAWREAAVGKTRMQARAGDLVPGWSSNGVEPAWLAEIVEITGAGPTARSICFETMAPEEGIGGAVPGSTTALNQGYPEFLISATDV